MFDYQQIFHVGHLVADIDRAMADIGDATGLEWARVQHVPPGRCGRQDEEPRRSS